MDITPPLRTRPVFLPLDDILNNWADWGFKPDDHHLILINFFESWHTFEKTGATFWTRVAKVLDEHYREAVFPPDADENPYVYWLAGPRRTPMHSYCNSREYFNDHYLKAFGPLFDVAEWLNEYRRNPEAAVDELAERAARMQALDKATRDLKDVGRPGNGSDENCDATILGRGSDYALSRLRKDRPDLHARVLGGEITAHAGMIEAGFRKPRPRDPLLGLTKLRRAWSKASAEERATFWDEHRAEMEP